MSNFFKNTLVVLVAFVLFLFLWKTPAVGRYFDCITIRSLRFLALSLACGIPIFITLFLIHKPCKIIESLGLAKGFLKGFLLAFLFTLPMFIGFACVNSYNTSLALDEFVRKAVYAGFIEELFFRGFLFGQLFRYARWGFIPSVLVGALIFGSLHMYQGNDIGSALSAFGITALGAVMFSWVYVEWNYNLWLPIGIHIFMNGSWLLFSVSQGASGDMTANIFRVVSILLIVGTTIWHKRKKGLPYEVNKHTLWINKQAV